jgi:hypothetical protein
MARVNRSVPFANGELLFCELPDGTRGTLPAWMTNAAACAVLTVGPPVVSIIALQELRVLLDAVVAGTPDPTGASMPSKEGCHAPKASVETQPPDPAVPTRRPRTPRGAGRHTATGADPSWRRAAERGTLGASFVLVDKGGDPFTDWPSSGQSP